MRSKSDIAIWCLLGAVIGWLLAALVYLYVFHWAPPWHYYPYEAPCLWVSLFIGVSSAPLAGLYATRRDQGLFTRIVIGAAVGAVIGFFLRPLCGMSCGGLMRELVTNPLFGYHRVTTFVIYFAQLGSVIAVALKGAGSPGAKYQFSVRAMLIVMTEWAMLLALLRFILR